MVGLNDFPDIVACFKNIYALDTEYHDQPGFPNGPVVPVALQAYEVRSGEWVSRFFDEPGATYANPLDPGALYIAFNASAEWNCFLSLGWQLPRYCLDLYIEFKNLVSGLKPPPQFRHPGNAEKWKSSLLSVAQWCGLPVRGPATKQAARDLILRGHPYSAEGRYIFRGVVPRKFHGDDADLRLHRSRRPATGMTTLVFQARRIFCVSKKQGLWLDNPEPFD